MTREKKLAADRVAYRAASLLTGALLLAGLGGCGNSLLGSMESSDASLTQKAKPSVAFSPVQVQGGPQKHAAAINDKLASSAKEKGVPIVDAKDAQYVIKASYKAVPEPKKGTKLAYEVDVTDKTGSLVRKISGEEMVSEKRGGDSWTHVTDEAVQRVASKSAADVNAWIDNPNAVPPQAVAAASPASPAKSTPQKVAAAAKPAAPKVSLASSVATDASSATPAKPTSVKQAAVRPGEAVAIVPAVTGAPGDGKTALADAMRKSLVQQGIKLVSTPSPSAYKVQGRVDVGAAVNGTQPVKIRWVVIDPSGKQLEKIVTQDNQVDEGRLDKAWGEIADQAGGAAAVEVGKLISKPNGGQAQQAQDRSAG